MSLLINSGRHLSPTQILLLQIACCNPYRGRISIWHRIIEQNEYQPSEILEVFPLIKGVTS